MFEDTMLLRQAADLFGWEVAGVPARYLLDLLVGLVIISLTALKGGRYALRGAALLAGLFTRRRPGRPSDAVFHGCSEEPDGDKPHSPAYGAAMMALQEERVVYDPVAGELWAPGLCVVFHIPTGAVKRALAEPARNPELTGVDVLCLLDPGEGEDLERLAQRRRDEVIERDRCDANRRTCDAINAVRYRARMHAVGAPLQLDAGLRSPPQAPRGA